MQRCICTVRLGGNLGSTSELTGVSPAEILVLRHVHGDDAVVSVRPDGNDRGQKINERDRLSRKYRGAFAAVFPGAAPALPESFKEVGINLFADDPADAAAAPQKPGKAGKAAGKGKGAASPAPDADAAAAPQSATQAVTADDLTDKQDDDTAGGTAAGAE